jgi:hypothetical protein
VEGVPVPSKRLGEPRRLGRLRLVTIITAWEVIWALHESNPGVNLGSSAGTGKAEHRKGHRQVKVKVPKQPSALHKSADMG